MFWSVQEWGKWNICYRQRVEECYNWSNRYIDKNKVYQQRLGFLHQAKLEFIKQILKASFLLCVEYALKLVNRIHYGMYITAPRVKCCSLNLRWNTFFREPRSIYYSRSLDCGNKTMFWKQRIKKRLMVDDYCWDCLLVNEKAKLLWIMHMIILWLKKDIVHLINSIYY